MRPIQPIVSKTPIPAYQISEHFRLSQALDDMAFDLSLCQETAPVGGFLAVSARRVMTDIYRLISREPGARSLLRLPAGPQIDRAQMLQVLADARSALASFERAHCDPDSSREDGWLVHEPPA